MQGQEAESRTPIPSTIHSLSEVKCVHEVSLLPSRMHTLSKLFKVSLSAGRRILSAIQLPSFVDRFSSWIRRQLPDLNPRNLLPLSFETVKGAITMGNHTTESLLLGQFTRAYGTFGIVQSRSALDDHKHMLRISFKDAAISCVENPDYWGSNQDIGKSVNECFVRLE